MRVLLVTSWGNACGIADHSQMLIESVGKADAGIELVPSAEALDPDWAVERIADDLELRLVHLNHHDALHSRWTPEYVQRLVEGGMPVLVTYHDTKDRIEDCPKLAALSQVASSVVVHEPVAGLQAIYWRQGVPGPAQDIHQYYTVGSQTIYGYSTPTGMIRVECFKSHPQQPVLGTVGFNFPWKNYDRLAQVTAEEGWALVILSNNATQEDEDRWRAANPSILVVREWLSQDQVVNYLAGCDATAFMYECANTGTSGAIRQGIAARKPVIALGTCRQFRDLTLYDAESEYPTGIFWVPDWARFRTVLQHVEPTGWDGRIASFAHQESWGRLGEQYAQLYRMLVGDLQP